MRRSTKLGVGACATALAFVFVTRRDRGRSIEAAEDACLAALLTFENHAVGNDGVTRDSQWQERFIRCDDGVWQARVLPSPAAKPPAEDHHLPEPYTMARWITPQGDDQATIALVSHDARLIVDVEKAFFENVTFDGAWSTARDVVSPSTRDGLAPMERGAPAGGRWLEKRSATGTFRLLWSDRLAIPLFVEGSTLDGSRSERVTVQVLPRIEHASAPWTKLGGYTRKEYADFGD